MTTSSNLISMTTRFSEFIIGKFDNAMQIEIEKKNNLVEHAFITKTAIDCTSEILDAPAESLLIFNHVQRQKIGDEKVADTYILLYCENHSDGVSAQAMKLPEEFDLASQKFLKKVPFEKLNPVSNNKLFYKFKDDHFKLDRILIEKENFSLEMEESLYRDWQFVIENMTIGKNPLPKMINPIIYHRQKSR